MQRLVITWIRLYGTPFTNVYISPSFCVLPNEQCYDSIGVKDSYSSFVEVVEKEEKPPKRCLKLKTNAFFLQLFLKACMNSFLYRFLVHYYLNGLSRYRMNETVFLELILEPPDSEIIDYAWNERILKLVWTRVEIENAFSWLSTLGGAYSALGDYFEHCADEAGRISIRQYKLSQLLGDESLAARSRLYAALALAQKGNLQASRSIVRSVADFGCVTQDKRLLKMCQGIWAKLKYLRSLKKISLLQQGKYCNDGDRNHTNVSNKTSV